MAFGLRVHGLLPAELKWVFVQLIGRGELTHNPKSIYKSVHVEKGIFFLQTVNGVANNYSYLKQLLVVNLFTSVGSCKVV